MTIPTSKKILGLLALIFAGILLTNGEPLIGIHLVHAQQAARGDLGLVLNVVSTILGGFVTFLQIVLLTILWIVDYLLSTKLFGDPLMMSKIKQIWILSRDIMNLLFAIMLVGVAFYTIVMANGELIKGKIASFVLAVILVNFSWFFPRVIIDVAHVLTATIYSVPNLLPAPTCIARDDNGNPKACEVIVNVAIFPNAAEAAQKQAEGYLCVPNLYCYLKMDYVTAQQKGLRHTMLNALAVNFAKLATLAQVPTNQANGAQFAGGNGVWTTLYIMVAITAVFIAQLALVAPLIGLAIGLLLRIIILWVTLAFMPFAFLGLVINGKLGTDILGVEDYIWKEFLSAAFLPAIVAVPFAIGFIMLSAVSQIPAQNAGFVLNVPIISGIPDIWGLLWMIAAIAIIWIGAFQALQRNKIIGHVTEKINAYAKNIGSGVAQLPLLTPLPLPGGGTLGSLVHGPQRFFEDVRLAARTGKSLPDLLREREQGLRGTATLAQHDGAARNLSVASNQNTQRLERAMRDLGDALRNSNNGARDRALQELTQVMRSENIHSTQQTILTDIHNMLQNRNFTHGRKADFLQTIQDAINRASAPPPGGGGGGRNP